MIGNFAQISPVCVCLLFAACLLMMAVYVWRVCRRKTMGVRHGLFAHVFLASLCFCAVLCKALDPQVCDVRDYGARGDNVTEDTEAVQAALDHCAEALPVVLPAGFTFLLRPVRIPSHTRLHIDGNIAAWRDIRSWPNSTWKLCPVTPYGLPRSQVKTAPQIESLLWAANGTNISIVGQGIVDGQGWRWWPLIHNETPPDNYWHNCRPSLLEFGRRAPFYDSGVTDVSVQGITLHDSAFWTFSAREARNLYIRDVHVSTSGCGYSEAPNTDGFNVQGNDIWIQDVTVRNGDDCVPIFPPTSNVTVQNITCECGNGLCPVVWPAMSCAGEGGNVTDISFIDAVFNRTNEAVEIKSLPVFVGTVSRVEYRNLQLIDVTTAIMINVYGQGGDLMVATSSVENLLVQNVTGTATDAGKIMCDPAHPCGDLELIDVILSTKTGQYEMCQAAYGVAKDCSPEPCLKPTLNAQT